MAHATTQQAKRVAKAIVNSPLVKTAVHGADPNWGRVAMAIGKCSEDDDIDQERVVIRFGSQELYPRPVDDDDLTALTKYLAGDDVAIHVSLGIARRRVHRVRLRPQRRVREDQRGLHDLTRHRAQSRSRPRSGMSSSGLWSRNHEIGACFTTVFNAVAAHPGSVPRSCASSIARSVPAFTASSIVS